MTIDENAMTTTEVDDTTAAARDLFRGQDQTHGQVPTLAQEVDHQGRGQVQDPCLVPGHAQDRGHLLKVQDHLVHKDAKEGGNVTIKMLDPQKDTGDRIPSNIDSVASKNIPITERTSKDMKSWSAKD